MYSRVIEVKKIGSALTRTASCYVRKANEFKSTISVGVAKDDRYVNAKSLLGVLSLGMADHMKLEIRAEGEDEEAAVNALCAFVENGFEG